MTLLIGIAYKLYNKSLLSTHQDMNTVCTNEADGEGGYNTERESSVHEGHGHGQNSRS